MASVVGGAMVGKNLPIINPYTKLTINPIAI